MVFSFDGTGGTAHISTSKETLHSYAPPGVVPPVMNVPVTVFQPTALAGTFNYVVTAVGDGDTESLASNEIQFITGGLAYPIINWAPVLNAIGYRVYRSSLAGDYTAPFGGLILGTTAASVRDDALPNLGGSPPVEAPVPPKAPDYKQAIGVDRERVQGCDITIPIFKFTFQYYPATALVTADYIVTLCNLAGKVNAAVWKGFQPGEVLFLGPSGQPRGLDDWEITMHFIASPNVHDLKVGDIENIVKEGHAYLWVKFEDAVSQNALTKVPSAVYVERVYDEDDFTRLGIGV